METRLKNIEKSCFAESRKLYATKYEYRVSGVPDAPIIDTHGNIRPSSVWGNTYFVDYRNGADTNNGKSRGNAFKTLSAAVSAVTDNNWDMIVGDPDSEVVETSMLSNTKNRFNIVGDTSGRILGPRFRVASTVTTGATNIATIQNTGVGVGFHGMKISNHSTVNEGLYSFAEGGEYSLFSHCEFYKSTDLNETGAAEILNNGDSAQWLDCVIGSTVNELVGAIIRPCMLLTATLSGKKCRDNIVKDCVFLRKGGNAANRFIYGANATDVERLFRIGGETLFYNNPLGTTDPGVAIDFGAAQTEGSVICGPNVHIASVGVLGATGEGVYVSTPDSPTYATSGLSVAS
jgi:hypothetical protein